MPSKIPALASEGLNIAFIESATAGRMCSEFAIDHIADHGQGRTVDYGKHLIKN